MELKRVVVTGMGALTPIGNTLDAYWQALSEGKSGSDLITKFDTTHFKTKFACELKGFNPTDFIDRKEDGRLDPFAQYAIVASDEAIQHSRILEYPNLNKNRVGVIWSSGIGGLKSFQDEVTTFATGNGTPRFSAFFIPKMILDIASGHISIKYGFRGPNFSVVSACASSTNGMIDAFNYIRLGKADAFVVGGSEAAITEAILIVMVL